MRISTSDWTPAHDDIDGVPPPAATTRLLGHSDVWAELTTAADEGRLGHAWLFQGGRGIGKAVAAFTFARRLAAPEAMYPSADFPQFDPDHPIVRQMALGTYPGLVHVTRGEAARGGGYRSQITVDEVRILNRFFHSTASGTGWRIAIVDAAEDLNRNAANAILKLLEEPPERALFILVTHAPGRLLPTIRSRCRAVRFPSLKPLTVEQIIADLMPSTSAEERSAAVAHSDGSARRALALAAGGGAEIGSNVAGILGYDRPDWNRIQAYADALTVKGREASYALFGETVLMAIADLAERDLADGNPDRAAAMAELWQRQSAKLHEANAYNLDRKQSVITLFADLFQTRAAH